MKKSLLLASSLLLSSFCLSACGATVIKSEALYVYDYAKIVPIIPYTGTVEVTVQVMRTSDTAGGDYQYWINFHDEIAISEVTLHGSLTGRTVTKVERSTVTDNAAIVTLEGDCSASSSYNLGFIAFASTSFDPVKEDENGATVYAVTMTGETASYTTRDYNVKDNSGWL